MDPDWLRYSNAGATRNQPISPQLISAMNFLRDLGVTMDVFSGGQPSSGPNRVGSHRHDMGNAADVMFFKDGRPLNWANAADRPTFEQIVQRARAGGVTGIGAGEGYMRPGSMHIGFGTPGVWGAGGSGANAPGWLRQAFGGGGGGGGGAVPTSAAQAMLSPTATTAPTALGDMLAPQMVNSTQIPGGQAGVAFDLIRNSQERKRVEAEEERAAQERRAALFTPPPAPLAAPPQPNVWSLYG